MLAHRIALALETLLFTLPISWLFIFGAPDAVHSPYFGCGLLVLTLRIAIVSFTAAALVAGWILSVRFIRTGTAKGNSMLWTLAFLGLTLAAIVELCAFLPPSEPNSCWALLRIDIQPFAMGLLLVLPMSHLLLLKYSRRGSNNRLERSQGSPSVSQGGDR